MSQYNMWNISRSSLCQFSDPLILHLESNFFFCTLPRDTYKIFVLLMRSVKFIEGCLKIWGVYGQTQNVCVLEKASFWPFGNQKYKIIGEAFTQLNYIFTYLQPFTICQDGQVVYTIYYKKGGFDNKHGTNALHPEFWLDENV